MRHLIGGLTVAHFVIFGVSFWSILLWMFCLTLLGTDFDDVAKKLRR